MRINERAYRTSDRAIQLSSSFVSPDARRHDSKRTRQKLILLIYRWLDLMGFDADVERPGTAMGCQLAIQRNRRTYLLFIVSLCLISAPMCLKKLLSSFVSSRSCDRA